MYWAGGSAVAISVYAAGMPSPFDRPQKFITVNRGQPRLDKLKRIHAKLDTDMRFEYILNEDPAKFES